MTNELKGKILITGGCGTLGSAIIKRATEEDWPCQIAVFSTDAVKHARLKAMFPRVQSIIGDIRQYDTLYSAMSGKDLVIHAGAVKIIPDSEYHSIDTYQVNVDGSMNVAMAAAQLGIPDVLAISTDKACLEWHSPVKLSSGKTKEIGELVNKNINCQVQSFILEPFGSRIGAQRVTGWFKNKVAGREMYKVSYEGAPSTSGVRIHVLATEDHEFLTIKDGQMGWVKAKDLAASKALLWTSEWEFNYLQEALLVGTMLGDANISSNKGSGARPRLRMGHAKNQEEWLRIKAKALKINPAGITTYSKDRNGRQEFLAINSETSASLFSYKNEFYKNGKKIIPRELVAKNLQYESRRAILLATWYLDDGCTTEGFARIATHSFARNDVEWLSETLNQYGFESYPYLCKLGDRQYYELRFTKVGSERLYADIFPAIPLSMMSKIPANYYPHEYNDHFWELGELNNYKAAPIVECVGKNKTGDVYCIDVEDSHNFIVNNMILHNCHAANAYGASKYMMEKIWQEYSRYGFPTRYHLVRYGNVLESTASVVEVWKRAAANGEPVKVTSLEMTRFWLSPSQAVQYVLDSLKVPGGNIYVPQMPALSIGKLLEYTVGKKYDNIKMVPLRPGEKMHETLVTLEETDFTLKGVWEDGRRFFTITPTTHTRLEFNDVSQPYTSDTARELTQAEFEELLKG